MKLRTFVIALGIASATFLAAQQHRPVPATPPQFAAILDLTHSIGPTTPGYDPAEKFEARTVATFEKDGYFARSFCMPEHFGTHLDAPAHFVRGRWTVEQIPPQRLVAPLVVIDVSRKAEGNPDYEVSREDVQYWEQINGKTPTGAVVVARTGWGSRWNSAQQYRNPDAKGVMHFPGWSLDAARFLVDERGIYGLGIDTLSVDPGPSKDFPVHKYVLAHSVYNLENVADLSRAPEAGATVVVAPAKLQGGSGAPVRIIALVK